MKPASASFKLKPSSHQAMNPSSFEFKPSGHQAFKLSSKP
jgi:hypothetical protein